MSRPGRPNGSKDGAGAAQPRPFRVRFDGHHWFVQQGKNWRRAHEVSILVGVIALPNGELAGDGVVRRTSPDTFVVSA